MNDIKLLIVSISRKRKDRETFQIQDDDADKNQLIQWFIGINNHERNVKNVLGYIAVDQEKS